MTPTIDDTLAEEITRRLEDGDDAMDIATDLGVAWWQVREVCGQNGHEWATTWLTGSCCQTCGAPDEREIEP